MYNLPEETTQVLLETWVQDVANVSGKAMLAKKEGKVTGWCWLCFENKQDADAAIGAINSVVSRQLPFPVLEKSLRISTLGKSHLSKDTFPVVLKQQRHDFLDRLKGISNDEIVCIDETGFCNIGNKTMVPKREGG